MTKILGLDLGTNSIGWALIDDTQKKILGTGSRIFPEGVSNLGQGENELSKNASRTAARGARRQFFRRKLRKRYLLRELAKNKLCPVSFKEVAIWSDRQVFSNPNLIEWFRLNPYELRAKALTEKITLEELGRIFYHLIQRRGFQSNSRSAGSDNDNKSVIFKGKASENKIGITETQASIEAHRTLGAYLHELYPKEQEPYVDEERIRNRYTTRQMYIDEFEAIWKAQKRYHPTLDDDLKTTIGGRKKDGYEKDGVLFHQRPLRSQKHLVGNCTFEPKKTKCPISAIPFELFRTYQWVINNASNIDGEKQKLLIDELLSNPSITISNLKKIFGDKWHDFSKKEQEDLKKDMKKAGAYTISNLKKFFGDKWSNFSEKEQEDIWHVLYFYEDRDKLKKYATEKWGFDEDQAKKISKFNLKKGYANLSRKAILNILPFLKNGETYDVAVAFGGIKNAFGSRWEKLSDETRKLISDQVYDIVKSGKQGGYMKHLKSYLSQAPFNLTNTQLDKLYHHSVLPKKSLSDKLPLDAEADKEIQAIRNPIVTAVLFELRKIINELIDEYGKPDKIKIELARDLKSSKKRRNEIRKEQKKLEKKNDDIKKELDSQGQLPTNNNILKYKLWEECSKMCPYTGKPISITKLFNGDIQIEHIMPYSRSLNDSFMNKTLCFADENRDKGNKTPYEFYSLQGKDKWEKVQQQARECFKNKAEYPNSGVKLKQFVKEESYKGDFISRQLNDTRYASKVAQGYLTHVVGDGDIESLTGQCTAEIRHKWGLNSILSDTDKKSRDDHRHHAVDALVIACIETSHFQELSKWNKYNRDYTLKPFSMPWDNFFEDAKKIIDHTLVSHKKTNNLLTIRTVKTKKEGKIYKNKGISTRGQLHKETVYGKRKAPHSEEALFHVRKPIESIENQKQLEKVVDPKIRELIKNRVEDLGGFTGKKGSDIPKNTFYESDNPQIHLPNRNGKPVPVKKVRMKENIGQVTKLKQINQYVDARNNHHVLIYKNEDGKLVESIVTFWKAVERKRQKQPVFQLPETDRNGEIITTLQKNDMFLLELEEKDIDWGKSDYKKLSEHLYRVQKISSMDYTFRKHQESKLDDKNKEAFKRIRSFDYWELLNPIKVKTSPTGKIMPFQHKA